MCRAAESSFNTALRQAPAHENECYVGKGGRGILSVVGSTPPRQPGDAIYVEPATGCEDLMRLVMGWRQAFPDLKGTITSSAEVVGTYDGDRLVRFNHCFHLFVILKAVGAA
ncbi:MAG: hypothetical protein ACR2N6_07575 [Miltoncostaeaceae bacterium]